MVFNIVLKLSLKLLLKLLGYAIGSVVMYWGLLFLLIAPWILALLLIVLINALWNHITGATEEWKWFMRGTDLAVQTLHQLKVEWIGWIPGLVIQIWYAGYAATSVQTVLQNGLQRIQTSTLDPMPLTQTALIPIVFPLIGVLGMVAATGMFYGIYHLVVEVKFSPWIYPVVGGVALGAYFVLLQQPALAQGLSASWENIFAVFLSTMIS